MEFVEEFVEAFGMFALMVEEKVQIVAEHYAEVDEVQTPVEVVNAFVEVQNYYYSLIEPLHLVVVVEEEVNLASLVETCQVVVEQVASEAFVVVH